MTPLPSAPALRYADHPLLVGNLHLPDDTGGPWPCVVLLHGGFWRSGWDRTLMTPLAYDLAQRGFAAWNVEYRGTGVDGGGWPTTLLDVAAALDHLATVEAVDAERVVTCGHSAGGHLALWSAARHRLPAGAPGAEPHVEPTAAVSLAGVCDLVEAARAGLDNGAVETLLGGRPDTVTERYELASPVALTPLGRPVLLVHGLQDDIVPVSQSRALASAAADVGDAVELVEVAGADHFAPIDPAHSCWLHVVERLQRLLA